MEFSINGEICDIQLEGEQNAQQIIQSFSSQLETGMIIASLSINEKYYSPDNPELSKIPAESIETIKIEAGTQEEISLSLLEESKMILMNMADDMKQNKFEHVKQYNELLNWIMETLTAVNKVAMFELAESRLLISTLTQVRDYMNSEERESEKVESLASILTNLIQYIDSIQIKLQKGFEITKTELLDMIEHGSNVLPEIAESFQLGQDRKAFEGIHTIINLLENCSIYFKTRLPELKNKDVRVSELYEDLNSILGEVVEAFEKADFVLIGDLMEYELPDKLDELASLLEKNDIQ